MRLDFRDPEPEVIDLSPEGGVVSTLKESKIDCLISDKVWSHFGEPVYDLTIVCSGRVSLLLPSPISWPHSRLPLIYRGDTTSDAAHGAS